VSAFANNRNYWGTDINKDYVDLAEKRIKLVAEKQASLLF
jgi:DNA modification methylase